MTIIIIIIIIANYIQLYSFEYENILLTGLINSTQRTFQLSTLDCVRALVLVSCLVYARRFQEKRQTNAIKICRNPYKFT